MIRNPVARRALSLTLMTLGGLLLFLAPDDVWIGTLLLALGIALEVAGTLMRRSDAPRMHGRGPGDDRTRDSADPL